VAGPERWLRELEEETGAISMGRLKAIRGISSGVGIGGTSLDSRGGANAGASTSGAKSANGKVTIEFEDGRKYLPDFAICTYEELLKTCQREMKVGCVVLVSDEHDDVPEFKR
jgi:FAS-associated factor 2